jgi:hypothetical protein
MARDKVLKKFATSLVGGHIFQITSNNLKMIAVGESFTIPRSSVDTVVVESSGWVDSKLKVVGSGTTLAEVKMGTRQANKAQAWILENIDSD